MNSETGFSLEQLGVMNILRLVDVVKDVGPELEASPDNVVSIRSLPTIVRISALMPSEGRNFREDYIRHREAGIRLLNKYGVVTSIEDEGKDKNGLPEYFRLKVDPGIFERFKDALLVPGQRALDVVNEKIIPSPVVAVQFDEGNGVLTVGTHSFSLEQGSLEYFICKLTCNNPGETVTVTAIIDAYDREDSKDVRAVRDGCKRLNKKISPQTNIERLFQYRSGHVRLRREALIANTTKVRR